MKANRLVQTKYRLQQRGAVYYSYSDLGASKSQQASSNPNINYSEEAQLIILILI